MHRHVWIDERLAQVPLFEGLSKKQLELVSSLATRLDVPASTELTREGGRGYEFVIVLEGSVEVRRHGRLIASRGAGEFFGEMALVDRTPRTATVRSTTPVVVEVIPRREFQALLSEVPDIAERIRTTMAKRRQDTMAHQSLAVAL